LRYPGAGRGYAERLPAPLFTKDTTMMKFKILFVLLLCLGCSLFNNAVDVAYPTVSTTVAVRQFESNEEVALTMRANEHIVNTVQTLSWGCVVGLSLLTFRRELVCFLTGEKF
jgi:hypothetical protein